MGNVIAKSNGGKMNKNDMAISKNNKSWSYTVTETKLVIIGSKVLL